MALAGSADFDPICKHIWLGNPFGCSESYTVMVCEASNYKECHELQDWCVDKALVNLQKNMLSPVISNFQI